MTSEFDEEMNNMCNLSEGVKEDARIEERINSAKEYINNLMKKNMTFDEAVDFLGVKEELVEILREEMNVKKA